ncbi:hypothetical protein SASPL_110722 [Salvia splendens]|uniref:E3 ubiquitin-protein ligase XBAT33 n=1 Tax=Salvia splendens TaxID=180675 RepID=A0A8X8YB21_SALSN|nr:hypothetical protein SASPL_110722 [Salvia splendens]
MQCEYFKFMVYLSYNLQDLVDVLESSMMCPYLSMMSCSGILQVTRADYLSGRTALHFATVNGHVRCMRLVLSDFVPSALFEPQNTQTVSDGSGGSNSKTSALSKFVNKAADGGITALHMAALNGYFDCVQLLLDLHGSVSAVTFHYGTSMDLIGAGSTPLHYAACGGHIKCCQILLAKGASRLSLNCNGWLPIDVARMWGRHWLEPLLAPNSDLPLPTFPHSDYLSLPLLSVLNIASVAFAAETMDCSPQLLGQMIQISVLFASRELVAWLLKDVHINCV